MGWKKITFHIRRLCNFKIVGKFSRRKYCCKHLRKCYGRSCKIKRKHCHFVGPTYTRNPASKCSWKRNNKNGTKRRRKCCYWTNYCVDSLCKRSKKTCKWVGSSVTVTKRKKCYWKQIMHEGKPARRQECCLFKKIKKDGKSKLTKKTCDFIGEPVLLTETFYKKK